MAKTITRKCKDCEGAIIIDVNDIKDVVYFKKCYYHKSCFEKLATKKSSSKRCSKDWKEALDDGMRQIEADARYITNYCYGRDLLYEHLLSNYDICSISTYCETTINKVLTGTYKGKSKPIPYRDFAECWVAIQSELDKIYANNKRIGKSMTGDQRINYDLAVVVRKIPEYLANKEKKKVTAIELAKNTAHEEVDMSRIGQQKKMIKNDISDIFNDLYIE